MITDTTEVVRRIEDEAYTVDQLANSGIVDVHISVESLDDEVARDLADDIAQAVHAVLEER